MVALSGLTALIEQEKVPAINGDFFDENGKQLPSHKIPQEPAEQPRIFLELILNSVRLFPY